MIKPIFIFFTISFLVSCKSATVNNSDDGKNDTTVILQNRIATLTISEYGGAITGFYFSDDQVNPLSWKLKPAEMPVNNRKGAPFQGHFICVGRWGKATPGENALGMPVNGEPSNNWWETKSLPGAQATEMNVTACLEQLELKRSIVLSPGQACFSVSETLTNLQNNSRFTVIVQHATIGTPFLDEKTVISANAAYGFNQALAPYSIPGFEYLWPHGYADTLKKPLDLTQADQPGGFVTTHVIESEYGWVTAASPVNGLLIGYLWRSKDYPWLHIWNGVKEGKPDALGLEFGTTGLGDTFSPEDRAALSFHGRNNNLFIDAKSSVTKKYFCFLIKIPQDFIKTSSVDYSDGEIHVEYLTKEKLHEISFSSEIW